MFVALKKPQDLLQENLFSCDIPLRFLDMNAGQHLSNHIILDYFNEAISMFLGKHDMTFGDVDGLRLVFAAANLKFKKPVFYPNRMKVMLHVLSLSKLKLCFYSELYNESDELCALGAIECAFVAGDGGRPDPVPEKLIQCIMR